VSETQLSQDSRVSVVVVSHGRPRDLRRCLVACSQLDYAAFELVVVADLRGLYAIEDLPFKRTLRIVQFDDTNISKARNLGIGQSGGDIVAFIDDDAVPEPTWLHHLNKTFRTTDAAAVCGSVSGRNGISDQSFCPWITPDGQTYDGTGVPSGAVPKLVGTNMAIRRDALAAINGFDPNFRFFLEDADLSFRLASAGYRLRHCPEARVHHAFAESPRRRRDRMPLKLDDIGRSASIFLDRHLAPGDTALALDQFRAAERRRLIKHLVRGTCEPRDVRRLMAGFETGVKETGSLDPETAATIPDAPAFSPIETSVPSRQYVVVAGRSRHRTRVLAAAQTEAEKGAVVTAFVLSPTSLYHKVRFTEEGYWLHTGGQFGRAVRSEPLVRAMTFRRRVEREWKRVCPTRCPGEDTSAPQIRWISGF